MSTKLDFEENGNSQYNPMQRPERKKSNLPSTKQILGVTFGIFMVIVYVGMGVLLMINFFNWQNDWAWTRWPVGVILVIYGIFRGWRTYKMLSTNNQEDE